jgi:hypothetical protein
MPHKTPNPETPTARHLSSSESRGPTLPRQLRDFADREHTVQSSFGIENPETPNSDIRDLMPRVLPMIDGSRYFGKCRDSKELKLLSCETPNANPDTLGSCATCPLSDLRLRLNREIAGRDSKEYETLVFRNAECRYADALDSCHLSLL